MKMQRVDLKHLEDPWKELYSENHRLSPYASFEYNAIFNMTYRYGWTRVFLWTRFYRFMNSYGETIMVVPLYGSGKKYFIFGDLASTGYLDFIYDENLNPEHFREALCLLGNEMRGCTLYLNRVNEKSMLNDYLASQYPCKRKDVCVNIAFGSGYDEYMKSLSKKMRHNIRTIRNRLETDDKSFCVEVMMNEGLSPGMKKEILAVYEKRQTIRYAIRGGFIRSSIRSSKNPICRSTACMKGNFNAILRIGKQLVAFLSGYVSNDQKTVVIPRHAIDQDYSKYSPGLLLISETIKWLAEHTCVRNLDLSRGDEPYKYALGGADHYNYSYEIQY